MSKSVYTPEIDGLRTIAVGAVLLYHVGFASVSGGFVGVDVFFVISGFLITRLILAEYDDTGRFDFRGFYMRRVRRLLPAALSTITATFFGATLLFAPEVMFRFAASAIAALLSVSTSFLAGG